MKLQGLYAITDSVLTPLESILDKTREAISGGARVIQFREKTKSDEELLDAALKLCTLCREMGAVFIVNDRVELARMVNAHGVHIGKDDADIASARRMLPGGIIGVSCYNSLDLAVKMEREGADYVAFGSLFSSVTKPEAVRADLDLIREAKQRLTIPVCAIGGITPENAGHVIEAGADMVAVISALWKAGDIRTQAERFACRFKG